MAGTVGTGASATPPLYGSLAWAYDLVAAQPAAGPPGDMARRLRSLGVRR